MLNPTQLSIQDSALGTAVKMAKEMLINVSEGEECRVALVEDGRLEELYMERTSAASHVGNIYKGRVTNVEPSIQAAFIDFGLGRNGFLHISDLMPTYFGGKGDDVQESVGRKLARRDRPPIQRCLHRGDEIVVQIIKEGIGTKGPTLSTYVSIPGRILVMMPGMSKLGVSRKTEDEEERRRLRQILDSLKPPRNCGFIIRTAGVGKTKVDIQRDLQYLTRLWQNIEKKMASGPGPMELYTEGDLITRTVRDAFTSDIARIVVDNKEVARRVKEFVKIAMPRTRNKVELYEDAIPLFHRHGIEKEIELMNSRHVPLPSGGSLVIDATEAVVAIDVNSGKFRDHADAELTAFKTDLEAADEIPRQLRLRDLGGVIICDFIDLRYERHRSDLEKRLYDNLRDDRAKTKMLRMSQFGIIEMTRQRMRPSLKRSIYFDCPHCKGSGLVKTPESMALDVMRRLAIAIDDQRVSRVELAVCPEVSLYLQNRKRESLAAMESQWKKRIIIRPDPMLGMDAVQLELYDLRDGLVFLEELGMMPQPPAGAPAAHQSGQRGRRDQRHRDQRDQRDQRGHRDRSEQPRPAAERPEDRSHLDNIEEDMERREEQEVETAGLQDAAPAANRVHRSGGEVVSPAPEPMESGERGGNLVTRAASPAQVAPAPPPARQTPAPARQGGIDVQDASRGRHRRGRRGRGMQGGRSQLPADQQGAPTTPGHQVPAATHEARPQTPPIVVQAPPKPAPPVTQPPAHAAPAHQAHPKEPARPRRPRAAGGTPRGGGRGRGKSTRADKAAPNQPASPPASAQAAPQQVIPGSSPVHTGSTDRHLMRDEPVMPPPPTRPKTYRDLDSIPDDID